MKTLKLLLMGLTVLIIVAFSQQASAQLTNFYSSSNYSNFINNMISNSIWNSSTEKYTGLDNKNSNTKPTSVQPEHRKHRPGPSHSDSFWLLLLFWSC
jgi:hypothetical protein